MRCYKQKEATDISVEKPVAYVQNDTIRYYSILT